MHQPIQEENIRIIRIVTGEDVIGNVTDQSEQSNITIEKPFRIGYSLDQTGTRMGIMLNPWVFQELCTDQRFVVKDRDILLVAAPSQTLIAEYRRVVSREYDNATVGSRTQAEFVSEEDLDWPDEDEEMQELVSISPSTQSKKTTLH